MAGIDTVTTLQDPYSEVSLFLSRKIKEQASSIDPSKGGSLYLQEKLLEKITPEFVKKFPHHRLGVAAIKKTWEKVFHVSQLFQGQTQAVKADGKLNIYYLIRENLRTALSHKKSEFFHPFLLAQQIALKVGNALASFEGIQPDVDHLTKLIWSAQQHLVMPLSKSIKSEPQDRLITKWMVDILMLSPGTSHEQLYQKLQDKLKLFQSMPKDFTLYLHKACMDWASLLIPQSRFYQNNSSDKIRELREWIGRLLNSNNLDEQILDIKTAALVSKPNISLDDIELFSWNLLKELHPIKTSSAVYDALIQEAKINLIHHPEQQWKTAILQAAQFCKKAHHITELGSHASWNQRIELWSLQGELVLRSLQFSETPLLHFVREMLLKNKSLTDSTVCAELREQYLSRYTSPLIEPSLVHQMADLIRKYGWYALSSTDRDTTLDRWVLLHLDEDLQDKVQKEFPLLSLELLRKNRNSPIKTNGIESH